MLAYAISPLRFDAESALDARSAFLALASAATEYLEHLDSGVSSGKLPPHTALLTRVRGTGPGASFERLLDALMQAPHEWKTPFENSMNVSGAVICGADVVSEERDDAFLLLQFQRYTKDLPLHIHFDSDRFIFAVAGRGFFHVGERGEAGELLAIKSPAVRDRDALMFRRGTLHTFSTGEHSLMLLSYHRPYVPLEDERQYFVPTPPLLPKEFLGNVKGRVSFDPAWSVLLPTGSD